MPLPVLATFTDAALSATFGVLVLKPYVSVIPLPPGTPGVAIAEPGVAAPCEASELVHFRHRIGQQGCELILQESIRINGKDGDEDKVIIDTTVQEKNITYPTMRSCTGRSSKNVWLLPTGKALYCANAIRVY